MNLVNYLKDIYGYDTPIFLKDIRIGGKSKAAIKEEFYRAVKRGELNRDGSGVYSLVNNTNDLINVVTFEKIIENKFIYIENYMPGLESLQVCGYYSGQTFLNMIGISEQVPAVLEVTTNRTSSKKRYYSALGRLAIVRKARTEINFNNWLMLQFLDMFSFLSLDEVIKNRDLIVSYIKKQKLTRNMFMVCIRFYGSDTLTKIMNGGLIDAFI